MDDTWAERRTSASGRHRTSTIGHLPSLASCCLHVGHRTGRSRWGWRQLPHLIWSHSCPRCRLWWRTHRREALQRIPIRHARRLWV